MWFRVDDKFHSHSKVRKVLADDPAALALWVVAGSWSSDNLEDGFVPDHQLQWLIPAGADALAQKLVAARLWRRVRGGYQFHDFDDWNMTADQVKARRAKRAEAGRKGGMRSAETRSGGEKKRKVHVDEGSSSERSNSDDLGRESGASNTQKPEDEPLNWENVKAFAQASASTLAQANAKQKRTPTRPDQSKEQKHMSPDGDVCQTDHFEQFWSAYPRRDGKKAAAVAYAKAIKRGITPQTLLEGAELYEARMVRDRTERSKIKMAQGWLNDERWEDEHAQAPTRTSGQRPFWEN